MLSQDPQSGMGRFFQGDRSAAIIKPNASREKLTHLVEG